MNKELYRVSFLAQVNNLYENAQKYALKHDDGHSLDEVNEAYCQVASLVNDIEKKARQEEEEGKKIVETATIGTHDLINLIEFKNQLLNEISHKNRELKDAEEIISPLKAEVLRCNENRYALEERDLEACLDLDSAECAIFNVGGLLKLGFKPYELNKYIRERWAEVHMEGKRCR